MKYVEPLNEPINSPYRNGNNANGEQGSIIPAQAIEHPMREVMHVIEQAHKQEQEQAQKQGQEQATPLTRMGDAIGEPDASDLTQLYQAIRKLCAPAGQIMAWGGSLENAPKGFLTCDGQAISRTRYADLFAVLGTLHGAGDDSSTFNLPDLRDRFVIGRSANKEVGATGGAFEHTLAVDEMPHHSHIVPVAQNTNLWSYGGQIPAKVVYKEGAGAVERDEKYGNTSSTGGGQPFGITNPYYALIYLIRT